MKREQKKILIGRQPPSDVQAEMALLGSMLLLPSCSEEISQVVQAGDFFDPAHEAIYESALALASENRLDPALLIDELKSRGRFETAGGTAYLSKIVNSVPNAAHANYYAEIVAEKALARRIIERTTSLLSAAYDDRTEKDELLTAVQELANSVSASHAPNDLRTMYSYASEVMDTIERQQQVGGVNRAFFGLHSVDDAFGPVMPGELCIVAARPGMGKTSFVQGIIRHSEANGRPGLLVSLEMMGQELATRELCRITNVDSRDVRGGTVDAEDIANMRQAQQGIGPDNAFWIWSPPSANFSAIRSTVKRAVRDHGVTCVAIDFFTRISIGGGNRADSRREKYVELTHDLKTLARECSVPLFVLAQLNREAEGIEPTKAMLRETGALEEDADQILFLHQEPNAQPHEKVLIVAKFRGGATGKISLAWNGRRTTFADIPGPEHNQQLSDWNR